jgi:hypothetical protein
MDNYPLCEVEDIKIAMNFVNDNAVKHENTPYSMSTVFKAAPSKMKSQSSQSSQYEERKHSPFSPHTLQPQNDDLTPRYVPTQHSLSHDLEDIQLENALKKAETENDLKRQARLRSMSAKYAGGWIRVLPSKSLSLDFKPQEFLILLKWWLGLPQLPSGHAFTCNQCGVQLDTLGYHALTCKSGGDLIYRHNTIRDAINKACLMAGWTPKLEKAGLIENSNDRPADVFIPSFHNGKSCAVDVAVTHALQPNAINYAARETAGAAKRYAIKVKDHKYKEVLAKQDHGIDFLPVVVDCFGAWDNRAIIFFKQIASSISKMRVKPYAETINQLMEKLSVCLMRANARALLKRRPILSLHDRPSLLSDNAAAALQFLDKHF